MEPEAHEHGKTVTARSFCRCLARRSFSEGGTPITATTTSLGRKEAQDAQEAHAQRDCRKARDRLPNAIASPLPVAPANPTYSWNAERFLNRLPFGLRLRPVSGPSLKVSPEQGARHRVEAFPPMDIGGKAVYERTGKVRE